MCAFIPMMIAAAVSAYGQIQQGKATQKIANNNAIEAGYAADSAQKQGEIQAEGAQRQADVVEGATRARLAAGGVDLGVGSAASVQAGNDFFGNLNVNAARDNAALTSYGYRTQAQNFTTQGNVAMSQARIGATSTIIGGMASAAGSMSGSGMGGMGGGMGAGGGMGGGGGMVAQNWYSFGNR